MRGTILKLAVAAAALVALAPAATSALASAAPTPRAQAAAGRCLTAQLQVRLGRAGVALGHVGQVVSFRNVSHSTCTLYGYPGLQMLDAKGRPIRTQVLRGVAYTVPAMPEHLVSLAPGGEASFDLGFDDATGYGLESCPTSSRVELTPPNAYRPITIAWRIQPYGGGTIQHLRCGQITVSPVFAGSSPGGT